MTTTIPFIPAQEVLKIIRLAQDGSTLPEIIKATGKTKQLIRQVCSQASVSIRERDEQRPITVSVRPKYEIGPGESKYDYARRILATEQRLVTQRGVQFLDGRQLRPLEAMRAANLVLKEKNLPQIEGAHEWMA